MKCSSCDSEFSTVQIKEKKRGLFASTIKCPECGLWLKKDRGSSATQNIGLAIWLIGMLGISEHLPLNQILSLVLLVGGFVLFLLSFKVSKWAVEVSDEKT